MILKKYFLKKLFANILLLTIGLTFLYNLIEFFEKMVRVKETTSATILYFIILNLIPSFFDNLPVGSWIGSIMTIIQMQQQNEWEILKLLNIKSKKIIGLVFIAGLALTVFSFVGKEIATNHLTQAAEKFRFKQFKQDKHNKLFNQWFVLKELFCHVDYLDLQTEKGTGLTLLSLSPSFQVTSITTAQDFFLKPQTKEIIIKHGVTVFTTNKKEEIIHNKTIRLPGFFTQLTTQGEIISLKQLFHVVIFEKKTLPTHVYHQLLYLFLNRILIHLLLLFYPLLTFLLFFLAPYHRYYRWILVFLPYPCIVILSTISHSFMQHSAHGLLAIIPYVTLMLATIVSYLKLKP